MQTIHQLEQLKILGDRQKLAVLKHLMDQPATLTQLGEFFRASPAHIRHHLKALEAAGFIELDSINLVRNLYEKYYRASAKAYQINLVILPDSPNGQTPLVIGSNDIALKQLPDELSQLSSGVTPVMLAVDSLDGLVKLREGICQMATCHLLDPDSTGYNVATIRCLFPGQAMAMIHLYHRDEGLIVRSGNPKQIRSLEDLTQPGIRLINRERGSGIRVWLDDQLNRLGIPAAHLLGYADEVFSHLNVANTVVEGRADVGLGLQTCAGTPGLEFIPLFEEPYDLVLTQETLADARLSPFFEHISSEAFRQNVVKIDGYRVTPDFGRLDIIS